MHDLTIEQFNGLTQALIPVVKQALREEFQALRDEFAGDIAKSEKATSAKLTAVQNENAQLARRVAALEQVRNRALIGWGVLMLIGNSAYQYLASHFGWPRF